MKEIQPVQLWINGLQKEATLFSLITINDNLTDSATFYFRLLDTNFTKLAEGNLTMSGEAYALWQTNQYAYDWIATQLNLTITGDYVPPIVEPIV